MQLLLAKNNQSFLHLSSNFSLYLLSFQYFFVSLPCQTPKMRLADILKEKALYYALSVAFRISQIQNFPQDEAMANAHCGSLYTPYLYILTAWASALLILGK